MGRRKRPSGWRETRDRLGVASVVEVGHSGRGETDVFNLEVAREHWCYAGEAGVVAHNECAVGGKTGIVNRGGRFAELDVARNPEEVGHHMPQNAYSRGMGRSRADGPSLGMTKEDHALTSTFASKGNRTMREDAGLSARRRMARDIRDVRSQFGRKYDKGIREMLNYAMTLLSTRGDR